MGSVEVVLHQDKIEKAVRNADKLEGSLEEVVKRIVDNANRLSSSFRTGIIHRDGQTIGDTQPEYAGDVIWGKSGYIGLVHPKNYSAMKDNYENNTLLKSL